MTWFLRLASICLVLFIACTRSYDYSRAEFNKDIIRTHNKYRAKHNVPPLVTNPKLSREAQTFAVKIAKNENVPQVYNTYIGKNIYWSPVKTISGVTIVKKWYDEIQDYNLSTNSAIFTRHFSQVVWKNSKKMGIGKAPSAKGVYVVVIYEPPGNIEGQYRQNVLPKVR